MQGVLPQFTDEILGGHGKGNVTYVDIEIEGVKYSLVGRATGVVPISGPAPVIELLSPASEVGFQVLKPEANDQFRSAVVGLVGRNQKFYTVLRHNWMMPAVCWSEATRV